MATQIHESEQTGFPLRVICIKETLESDGGICFGVPCNWDFHIISHTWTEDARNWSVEIASSMAERKTSGKSDAYAELFKQENFAGKRGYTDLLEFLSMLAVDGVQRVWFDALCINQKDGEEKNREIARMGEYYARSSGCYVWCHGMGGGFRLLAEGTAPRYYTLPRWFSRVWTLQEFVLPTKLAFIVGMDMAGCTALFAYKAICRSTRLSWQPTDLIDNQTKAKFLRRFQSDHQVNSREFFPCPHCKHQQIGHVYFVERENYLELMERSSYKSIGVGRLASNFWIEFKSPLQRLLSILSCSDQVRRLQLAALVVREISVRDCSEFHDEDRLLSILGLLQVEGKVQLRTGRGLHEQIYDLAQSLVNSNPKDENGHQILLLLCVAQYRGSPICSMSWAPTFTPQRVLGDMYLQSLSMFHNFTSIAQVLELDKPGLVLRCPFLRAKAIPFAEHQQKCNTCFQCRQAARINPMGDYHILEVHNRHHYSVLLWVYSDMSDDSELRFLSVSPPTLTMSIKSDTDVKRLRTVSFHVYLLLIAQDQLPGSLQPYGLFMVCTGKDTGSLHKVGVFICGPGWDPETMEEPETHDTRDNQSGDSMSEGEDGCFNNEELEDFQDSQIAPWKDDFPGVSSDDELELDRDEEENEEEFEEEDEHECDDEVDANNPSWEQDVQSMEWARFIVGGFGAIIPSDVLSLDQVVK